MENSESQSEIAKFECPYCHIKIKRILGLKRHIFQSHFKYGYSCPYCNKSFTSIHKLQSHLALIDDDYHRNFCHLITKRHFRFVNKNLFLIDNSNVKNVSQKSIITLHMSKYCHKCLFCDFRTKYKRNLEWHIMINHYNNSINCPYCNYRTENLENLIEHTCKCKDNYHQSLYKFLQRIIEENSDLIN